MKRLLSLCKAAEEGGQVLIIVAGMLPVLLGMTGLAIDVATYAGHRRSLQNAADSIALAASHELPNQAAAQAVAEEWAVKNDVDIDDMTLTITTGAPAPKVHVRIDSSHRFAFMKVLGVDSRGIGASAAAVKVSYGGGAGIVPWSITDETRNSVVPGELVTMKYDATGVDTGNFGAIRIDGPGSKTYEESVRYGSTELACADTTDGCTTEDCPGDSCAETSPTCDGPECTPQTGDVIGPTRAAVDFRISHTSAECDTFEEVFGAPDAGGKYRLAEDCNPWLDGPGKCTSNTDICSRRVIIIPVVDEFGSGASDPGTITEFALLFLEGYDGGKCQGNSCEIKGRFANAELTANGLAGVYDPDAALIFTRLIE